MSLGGLTFLSNFRYSFLDDHGDIEIHRRCANNTANLDMNTCIYGTGGGLVINHCVCDTNLCNEHMAEPSSGNKIILGPILIASMVLSFAL